MAILGGIGLGLAWGWFWGLRDRQGHKPFLTIAVASAATLLLACVVYLLTDWRVVAVFMAAGLLAFLLHHGWRKELSDRFGRPDSGGGSP